MSPEDPREEWQPSLALGIPALSGYTCEHTYGYSQGKARGKRAGWIPGVRENGSGDCRRDRGTEELTEELAGAGEIAGAEEIAGAIQIKLQTIIIIITVLRESYI